MKTLLITMLLFIFSTINVAAQYTEGQENNTQEGIMTLSTLSLPDENNRMCTMQYAPVCAEVQVQCIKAPCYSIKQTFWNTCTAWDNPILFQWECTNYLDEDLYNKFEEKRTAVEKIVSKVNHATLIKMNELIDEKIKMIKMTKISLEVQKQRITKYAFIKSVVNSQLSEK